MRGIVLTLAVWILAVAGAVAQEIPRWTPERQKIVFELLDECARGGGIQATRFPDGKGTYPRVVDRAKLRATLAARRKQWGPELRDALLGFWFKANEPFQATVVVLLELAGREAKDEHALGLAAFLAGFAAQKQQRLKEATAAYHAALSPFTRAKQPVWQAASLNNLGFVLQLQGSYAEALDYHKQALAVNRTLYAPARYPQGHHALATSLNNVAVLLQEQGSYAEARHYFKQALEMFRRLYSASGYPTGQEAVAASLNNLGRLLQAQGAYSEALEYFKQVHELVKALYPAKTHPDGHPNLASSLSNLGAVQADRGLYREALDYFREALAMDRKLYARERFPQGHANLALSLNNMGFACANLGSYGEAGAYHKQALDMSRNLYPPSRFPEGHPDLVLSLNNLASVLRAQGAYAEALSTCKQSLAMTRKLYPPTRYPQGHPDLAASLNKLGDILQAQGSYPESLDSYAKALQNVRLSQKIVNLDAGAEAAAFLTASPQTANTLRSRALLLTRMLDSRASAARLRRAERAWALSAALYDRLRSEVWHRGSDKLQHGETADRQLIFHVDILARLFHQEGRTQDLQNAFVAIEQGRARVFLESLGQAHAATLAGLPAPLAAEERRLSLALRELDARIQRLSLQPGDEPARQVRQLYADRLKLEEEEKVFLDKLRQSHPQYAGFRHPQPCRVEEARSCLRNDEVAVLFAVGTDFSYALLLEKVPQPGDRGQGIALFRLPGGKELNPLLGTLLTPDTLQHPARARELAAELYRKLLGPLHERLKGKDLLLVPDGALALLPFELLVEGQTDDDDGHWLIEQHRVRYAPSLSALHLSRQVKRQKPTQALWALADPLFGDKFRRLAHSAREVESICKVLAVPVEKTLRGARASEAAVKAARDELAKARFVHFATHGIVSERSAYGTALVLNQVGNDGKEELGGVNDGFLRLPEVTFLKLNADVVVLSACETARGRRSGGEGISGLARTFLYAGSKGVVCSLWSVDDARTADLMISFYNGLKAGKATDEALRQAKRAMIEQGQAPFFWAAFIHMGR